MAGEIKFKTNTVLVKGQIVDEIGEVWDGSAMAAESALSSAEWTAGLVTPVQGATTDPEDTGLWIADWPELLSKAARYAVLFYSGESPGPGSLIIGVQQDPTEYADSQLAATIAGLTSVGLADTEDVYHADIDLSIDEANTQDEYTASWFKNGVRITSGITAPKIQVVKRVDGADLIAQDTMTEVGSTGSYKFDEDTDRITAGEAVVVLVTATIGGSSREFARVASRDSE